MVCNSTITLKVFRESKTFNVSSLDKKNLFTSSKFFVCALDSNWPSSRSIKLSVSFDDAHRYRNRVWLDFILHGLYHLESARQKVPVKYSTSGNSQILYRQELFKRLVIDYLQHDFAIYVFAPVFSLVEQTVEKTILSTIIKITSFEKIC